MTRRLAAIMAADVVGYSRLVRRDEDSTLAALKGLQSELLLPKITEHNGRVVKLMGDGLLAEFGSVIEATKAAVDIQHEMAERYLKVSSGVPIQIRIGLNLGDVVIDGDDICRRAHCSPPVQGSGRCGEIHARTAQGGTRTALKPPLLAIAPTDGATFDHLMLPLGAGHVEATQAICAGAQRPP